MTSEQPPDPARKVMLSIAALAIPCIALAWSLSPAAPAQGVEFGDLSGASFVEIRTMDGDVAMSGELRNRFDAVGDTEKDAALHGQHSEQVVGEVEIEIPRPGSPNAKQELEVDVISLEPRTSYQVFVDDRAVATFTTDDRGSIDIELSSATATPEPR
ncbi:MAG: hypothetical protein AB7F99_07235 [Vicinamibacterales bacterium]